MASSSYIKEFTSYATGNNLIAFKLTAKESMNHIPQPVSSDEALVKNWQRQILIPFVVDRKLFSLAMHMLLLLPLTSLSYSTLDS